MNFEGIIYIKIANKIILTSISQRSQNIFFILNKKIQTTYSNTSLVNLDGGSTKRHGRRSHLN
jgi:hypothetical protein